MCERACAVADFVCVRVVGVGGGCCGEERTEEEEEEEEVGGRSVFQATQQPPRLPLAFPESSTIIHVPQGTCVCGGDLHTMRGGRH